MIQSLNKLLFDLNVDVNGLLPWTTHIQFHNLHISEYSNKALNRPIFAASGMVNSEGVLVDGNRLPNVITSKYVLFD